MQLNNRKAHGLGIGVFVAAAAGGTAIPLALMRFARGTGRRPQQNHSLADGQVAGVLLLVSALAVHVPWVLVSAGEACCPSIQVRYPALADSRVPPSTSDSAS